MPDRCNTVATGCTCQFLCEQYVIRMMFADPRDPPLRRVRVRNRIFAGDRSAR